MKKLLALVGFALLTACITVDDFGEYWEKGAYDVDLVGTWSDKERSKEWTLTQYEKGYKIKSSESSEPDIARTLITGPYKFLMMHMKEAPPEGGVLLRYVADKKKATMYKLASTEKVKAWIDKYYPDKKLFNGKYTEEYPSMKKLDSTFIRMIADMPDSKDYWEVMMEFTKKAQ